MNTPKENSAIVYACAKKLQDTLGYFTSSLVTHECDISSRFVQNWMYTKKRAGEIITEYPGRNKFTEQGLAKVAKYATASLVVAEFTEVINHTEPSSVVAEMPREETENLFSTMRDVFTENREMYNKTAMLLIENERLTDKVKELEDQICGLKGKMKMLLSLMGELQSG